MIVDFSMISIPHTAFLLTEYVRLCPIIIEIINGSHELVSMPTFKENHLMTTARDALRTTSIFRLSTFTNNLNFLNQSKYV
jgi:hypothetical protein